MDLTRLILDLVLGVLKISLTIIVFTQRTTENQGRHHLLIYCVTTTYQLHKFTVK
jgi:hypothetical protein